MGILNVDNIQPVGGGTTITLNSSEINVGAGITFESNGQAIYAGIITATSFVGNLTGNPTGTLQTAAQPNITSVGTLSGLTVSGTSVVADLRSTNNNYVLGLRGNNSSVKVYLGTDNSGNFLLATGSGVAERLRIDSSGRLMIGTTTPSSNSAAQVLTIANTTAQSTNGNCGITIRSGSTGGQTNEGSIFFSDATSGAGEYAGYLQYSHASNYFRIGAGSAERFRVSSNGNATITDGDLVLASGHGIDFSATANSSGSNISELLDDYEEGSWVPTWHFTTSNYGPVYTHQMGAYTKIGRQVTVYFSLKSTSVNGSTGNLQIAGLPFTDGTSPVEYPATAGAFPIFGFTGWTGEYISLQVVSGKIQLYGVQKSQTSYDAITHSQINGGGTLHLKGQVTYNV